MICAHPDMVHDGIIPAEILPDLLVENFATLPSIVRLWATANFQDSRVDDSFRDFISHVEAAAGRHDRHIGGGYLPAEVFEYLTSPQKVEPPFNDDLIANLSLITKTAANQVSPLTMVNLIERLRREATEPKIKEFASEYLIGRTVEATHEELAALSTLRELAQVASKND